jgi:outer membrane protein
MKYLLLFPILLLTINLNAQTEKGSVLVGGNLALNTGEGASEFTFSPDFGVFVANNFAVGGFLNFSDRKLGDTKLTDFGIGPFARYYFGNTSTKPFVVTEFNYLTTTSKFEEQKNTTNGIGFLLGMGFAAFINEVVAVEGISGYKYSKYKDADGSNGFSLRFGFQIYLNNKSMKDLKKNVIGE